MRCLVFCVAVSGLAQSVWFEPNQGQVHPSVQFLARTGRGYAYFAPNRMAVRDVRMQLVGARESAQVELEEPTGGITSYFIGRTEKDWHTGIPQYRRVRYENIYSGIDVVYYVDRGDVEYDFMVGPGADPNQIRLAYNKPVRIDSNGDLLVAGLRQKRPRVFQQGREIACDYLATKDGEIHLALARYNSSESLTVDPVLEFSTYLGGPAEEGGYGLAFDAQNNVYLAGASQAPAQPGLNPFQNTTALINSPVVFKITPDGQKILWYVFVGDGGWDQALGIAVDGNGSAITTGDTRNPNFPLKNAFQTQYKSVYGNAFVTKVSPDGKSLVYSSYIGGSYSESATGIAIDPQGNALITGQTGSDDFPVKQPFQRKYGGSDDCYAAKIGVNGDLLWSTYLGGSGGDGCGAIASDAQGNSYLAGSSNSPDFPLKNAIQTTITPRTGFQTPLLIKLDPSGSITTATFVGGPVAGFARAIALDAVGNVYTGGGADQALITQNAFQPNSSSPGNGFLIELDETLQHIVFSTYFGGSGSDWISKLALDQSGNIYLAGPTSSSDFPVKSSFQSFVGGGVCQCDIFVTKFAPGVKSLIYSTLLGGDNGEMPGAIAVDSSGNAYVTGWTLSDDFPTKNAYQSKYGGGGDFFFAKISDNTTPAPSPLTPTPGHLTFLYTQAGAAPGAQTVPVAGPAFTAATTVSWLVASASGSNVSISANPVGLAPNTYTGSVTLTPQTGTPASIDVSLTVLAAAPILTSVDPALVPMGSNDTTITVHGSGFTSSSVLQVDGIPWTVTPVQIVNASTLIFSMPATYFSVLYNHTIAVQNPQSALSNVLSIAVGQPAPQFTVASVVNAASYATGAVAPGEIVTVFGSNFGTQSNTTVSFNNIPATLVYVTPTQLAATVPYSVAGLQKTTMTITSKGVASVPVTLNLTPAVPAIFTADASGKGQAAAINQDNSINGPSNPAPTGTVVALYGTGGGTLTSDALPRLALPVTATVGGVPATVYYAGIAPGLVQGAMQVNIQIPAGVTPGSAVPVIVTVGNAPSNTVVLAIK